MLEFILAVIFAPIIFIIQVIYAIYRFFAFLGKGLYSRFTQPVSEPATVTNTQPVRFHSNSSNDQFSSVSYESHLGGDGSVPNCPVCGSTMILRTAKRGRYKGQDFWGCSRFPNCTAIVNLNDSRVPSEVSDMDYDPDLDENVIMSEISDMFDGFDPDLRERYYDDVKQFRRKR